MKRRTKIRMLRGTTAFVAEDWVFLGVEEVWGRRDPLTPEPVEWIHSACPLIVVGSFKTF